MRQPTKYIRLIFILLTIGCTRQTNDSLTTESSDSLTNVTNYSKPTTTDSTTKTTDQKREVTLIVKDSTKYSKRFLDGLRTNGPGTKFVLTDNQIVTDDHYHNGFSEIMPLNKEIILKATKGDLKYLLTVSRINYTTITYSFKLTGAKGEIINERGQADLSTGFMLGSETSQDDAGNVYGCDQYFAVDDKCIFSITIGKPADKYLGQVIGCGEIDLDVTPTLK